VRSFLFIIVSSIFYVALTWITGIYYGWIDDVWLDLSFQGKIMVEEAYSPVVLITGFGDLIKSSPLTLSSLYAGVVIFVFYLTLEVVERHVQDLPVLSKALLMSLVVIGLIWPILMTPTFTELSILAGGLGLIYFNQVLSAETSIGRRDYFLFGFAMLIAISFRFTSLVLLLPFIGILLANHGWGRHRYKAVGATIFLAVLSISSFLYQTTTLPLDVQQKQVKLRTVLDTDIGMRLSEENPKEFAKDLALYCWFLGDTSVWTTSRLDKKTSEMSYSVTEKWASIYHKAAHQYPEDYHPESNWLTSAIVLLSLSLLLIFRSLFLDYRSIKPLILFISILVILVLTGTKYKLEGRAVIPLITVLLVYLITMSKKSIPAVCKGSLLHISIWCIPLGAYSMVQHYRIGQDYSKEVADKKAYVEHLDTVYKHKSILVDLFAMTLFHSSLTEGLNIPENLELKSYPELWGVIKALEEKEELPNPSNYFLSAALDTAYYLGPQFRVDMLEGLLNEVYNTPISFEKIEDCPIEYSFTWDPLNLGIYQINLEQ
jgi:hypothetical protein